MYKDLKKFQAELAKYNDVKYASNVEIDCEKAKGDLLSYKMEFKKSSNVYTQKINDLNQMILDMKKELFAHQETISILSQQKEAQLKFYKTRKDKEIDKVIVLENKIKDLDNIVYKTSQSVQTMNMLNRNCKTSFAKPEFLKKAQRKNPHLYDIVCYNDNLVVMLAPKSDEVIRLEKESRSKLSDLIRPFDYEKLNNLYDLFVPQREKLSAQRYFLERSKMSHTPVNNSKESFNKQTTLLEKRIDESILYDQKCKSSKEIIKIKKSVGAIINGVKRCKQTIAKRTYFGHIDPFIQNTIEGNFCPEIQRISADLENFHLFWKEEMVVDLRYFNSLELEVDSLKSQLKTQKTQFLNEIDRLSREYYYVDHLNAILGVYTEFDKVTNLQCDYLETLEKCKYLKKELSKSKMMSKSFEALQNILNAKTSNVNFVCITCGKCVLNDKHDMHVLHSRNDVNSRTKIPMAMPVSTREPKRIVNQSVAEPLRRTFALESTNQKPRHTTRKLYEHVTKTCMVKFENDQIAPIIGYGDLVHGAVTIKRVYYVEGLNYNLFSVSQFCDADLEVAFRKSTCYICDLKGNDLLTEWLWHHRLSHLNFDTINLHSKNDIVIGLPKLTIIKDHLCSSCELEKPNESLFKQRLPQAPKDGYNFYTWTYVVPCGQNKTLHAYFASKRINHQTFITRTPEQNGVVERRNRTLVEATRTMLSTAKVPLFFWAEAIATTFFTQNRSLVIPRHEKTPYHIINDRKPSVKFFHIFGSLCYIVKDGENLDKMKEKGDACIFIGTALEHDSLSPSPQCQDNVPHAAETVTTSNELDLLFSLMFDELLNGSTQVVSKSSAETTADAPNQSETNSEDTQVEDDEFINIFCTTVQDRGETSSRHLESDGEMCMFALTVSRTKPKNIKKAMADFAWIESIHEELHQFDRLDVWELIDIPLCKNVINMKWLWKNKRDKENTVNRNKSHLVA
nr:hypothetical protein [Tanacetum cinerariifolium]